MAVLVETCVVLLTVGVLALVVFGILTLRQFGRVIENSDQSLLRLELLLNDASQLVTEGRELLLVVGSALGSEDEIIREVGGAPGRNADAARAGATLHEVGPPAHGPRGIARGIRAAVRLLQERWARQPPRGW